MDCFSCATQTEQIANAAYIFGTYYFIFYATQSADVAKYARYVKEINIYISLQDNTKDGKIYVPYFTLKYAEVDRVKAEAGETVPDGKKGSEVPVSIWRTYFVANEWNEIQATRKINKVFQIFAVVFFLEVVGFVNTTTKDPDGSVEKDSGSYQAEQSFVYRYALAVMVYLVVGVVQWIFFTFIYERFIEDKVQQFVDLCSMSNISAFIMAHSHFGYYIHGRSVHGKADTNMREMCGDDEEGRGGYLQLVLEDLCGQRGLVPNTEQQTFMMSLPKRLRVKYEQVYLPAALESLRDVDYVVKDKTLLESVMDTEFFDATEKGIFYNDMYT
nr:hypothetical protein BaRGS_018746 [Batillaria attramentaria]